MGRADRVRDCGIDFSLCPTSTPQTEVYATTMTRRRFYAPPSAFDVTQNSVTLIADEARHLREALRLKTGDEVYVFNGEGKEFLSRIEESRRDVARLQIIREVEPAGPESQLQLTLALALLKGEKFDLVVQKATELGVTSIVPVMTRH